MDLTIKDPKQRTDLYILIVVIWHGILAAASVVGLTFLWMPGQDNLALWLRILLSVVLLIAGSLSALNIRFLLRREHRGRVISLILNYLIFLVCLFGAIQVLGVFVGIDALSGTFGHGIPWLAGVLAGYLVSAFGDRFEHNYDRQMIFRRAGQIIMLIFGIIFLIAIDTLHGLWYLLTQFNNPLPFLFILGLVLTVVMLFFMWRSPTAAAFHARSGHAEMLNGFLLLSPNLLGFLFFFAGPLLLSFYTSFTDWDAFGTRNWIGGENYAQLLNLDFAELETADQPASEVLDVTQYSELTRFSALGHHYIIGAEDKLFWLAVRNTVVFALMALPLSIIPALLLAALLNSRLPGMKFFRAVYFLPSVAATVGVALIWQWLYNAAVGYINYTVTSMITFLNTTFSSGILDPQIRWLSDTNFALLAVVIMVAWQWIGYNTVLFLAGMQNIPRELYEAATVDGANAIERFFNVTIPLLAPTTFFVITTAVISAMQIFEQVYVLIPTEPPGGPNNSTLTIVLYLYQKGYQRFDQGYASAVAWVLFALIFVVTLLQFQRQRKSSGAYNF